VVYLVAMTAMARCVGLLGRRTPELMAMPEYGHSPLFAASWVAAGFVATLLVGNAMHVPLGSLLSEGSLGSLVAVDSVEMVSEGEGGPVKVVLRGWEAAHARAVAARMHSIGLEVALYAAYSSGQCPASMNDLMRGGSLKLENTRSASDPGKEIVCIPGYDNDCNPRAIIAYDPVALSNGSIVAVDLGAKVRVLSSKAELDRRLAHDRSELEKQLAARPKLFQPIGLSSVPMPPRNDSDSPARTPEPRTSPPTIVQQPMAVTPRPPPTSPSR
jgi:hypothetical protein